MPGTDAAGGFQVNQPMQALHQIRLGDLNQGLHAAVQVTVHQVSTTNENLGVAVVSKGVDARVLQVAAQD